MNRSHASNDNTMLSMPIHPHKLVAVSDAQTNCEMRGGMLCCRCENGIPGGQRMEQHLSWEKQASINKERGDVSEEQQELEQLP